MAGVAGQRAFDDLGAHYRDPQMVVPFDQALEDLRDGDGGRRSAAGSYLRALFEQSLADERNGRAPGEPVPYWGGGVESAARELRGTLAKTFGERAEGSGAQSALEWLIDREPVASIRSAGVVALQRVDVPAAMLRRILDPPHSNGAVLLAALEATRRRRFAELARPALALCRHPRSAVRAKARQVADTLGLAVPAEPAPAELLTPALERDLRAFAAMPFPRPSRTARFVWVRGHDSTAHASVRGLVLGMDDSTYRILDLFGHERQVPRSGTTLEEGSLADESRRLLAVRSTPGGAGELSDGGDITAQFAPRAISVPEALVAGWCFERGDRATAATLILPRLDAVADDRDLVAIVRNVLGVTYYKETLKAFSYDRDYPRAIARASHVGGSAFDGFEYQPHARELAEQLRGRSNDFRSLTLPDSASWIARREHLSRAEQVVYLARRLRLLNAFQEGQPGGVALFMDQYEDPWHMNSPWDDRPNPSRRLINPLRELYELHLDPGEIPLLLPFLADRAFAPTFGFWRDFHPDWNLYRVATLVEDLVNSIACRPLVHVSELAVLNGVERRAYLDRVESWSRAHAGMDEERLDLDVLETTTNGNEFEMAARKRLIAKDRRAVPIVLRRMDEFPRWNGFLVQYLYLADAPEAAIRARHWLAQPDSLHADTQSLFGDRQERFYSLLTLLRHGDRARFEGLDEMDGFLEKNGDPSYSSQVEAILGAIPPDTLRQARCRALDRRPVNLEFSDGGLLRRLVLLGCRNAFALIMRAFDSEAPAGSSPAREPFPDDPHRFPAIPVVEADRVASMVGFWRGTYYDDVGPREQRLRMRVELRSWLAAEFRKIEAGEPVRWR